MPDQQDPVAAVPVGPPRPERLGSYRVIRCIGRGGMGAVYLAVHEQIGREVAIKLLRADLAANPDMARRFLNEARAVNLVRHPGLVQVTDHGLDADGTPFIVMEHLDGVSLRTHLQEAEGGRLPERAALGLVEEIAGVLAAAHAGGIVHRDLKPDNIMLVTDPDQPGRLRVKVLDFGIAKLFESTPPPALDGSPPRPGSTPPLTRDDAVLGTPAYMAPEQWRSTRDVDDRADVYSLGVILYKMLGGRPPFAGSAFEVKGKHLYDPPPPLRELLPELTPGTERLVASMLAKAPAERPSMRQVEEALASSIRLTTPEGGARPQKVPPSDERLPLFNGKLGPRVRSVPPAPMLSPDRILPGAVIGDRFEIERLANAGGMGDVFRARDRLTGAPAAVKFVRNSDPMHLSRFEREARALAQFEHPGIVRYIAHGSQPTVFLAMEWLEGEDLSRRLARGALSISDTLLLARIVADALAAAHLRGIVHRDIKPSNIFLSEGRIEAVKILDFGIAQVTQSTRAITNTGQLLGTLGYMAPEQALSGRDVTAAVDIYSLGCVLFECFTGTPAFAGEWQQVLSKILVSEPPRLRDVMKDAPLALDDLIARMLRRDPAARASLVNVSADLAAFLTAGEMFSTEAHPGSVPAVTGDERHLFAVIVADTPIAPVEDGSRFGVADTVPSSTPSVQSVVAKFGGELVVLPGGTSIITLNSGSGGADLVTRAARCALAIRSVAGEVPIALASGRGHPIRRAVVSEIIERARELLETRDDAKLVRIDTITAGLLDASFVVRGNGSALVLVGEHEQSGARKLLGKATPCVGRERELAMLNGLVAECLDESLSTALLITGDPGVGKSRVRHEVIRALQAREDSPDIWIARGDSVAAGSPFAMLGQLLRRMAGLEDGELVEVRRQKLLARVGRHLPIHDAIRVAEFLGDLVHAEFSSDDRPALRAARQDPASMSDQLRRAWDDLIAAETAAGPIAIVLEDLQWGDLPTIRLLDSALRNQRHRPLLVISVARPEVHEAFPGLFRDRRVHEVRLADLTPTASRRLVLDVLGPETDRAVVDALVERSHGNAFYLEELIRSVAEGDSSLPETVLATAQARLQRLDPGARRLLRAASVFGARFWLSGIAALVKGDASTDVKPTLEALVQREVIKEQPSSRYRGDAEYVFRHILVRDAAYEMLTERDRESAHALAADWLESKGERDALVHAEHLERSGERQRAVVWYLWAAEQALEASDLASVLLRAERGVQCGATGAVLGELTLLEAEASGWARHDTHFALAQEALDLLPPASAAWTRAAAELTVACRSAGDDDRLRVTAERVADAALDSTSIGHAWARARIIVELLGAGQPALAERLIGSIEKALPGADETDTSTLHMMIDWLHGASALYAGTPEPLTERALTIADTFEATGNARWAALVALHATIASAAVSDHQAGISWAERAGDLARRLGLRSCEVRARAWLAFHLAESGHVDAAVTTAESAVRDAPGDRVADGDARVALAHAALAGDDPATALEEAQMVWSERASPAEARGRAGALLAHLLLRDKRTREAFDTANEAIELLARVRPLGDAAVRKTRDDALDILRASPEQSPRS